MDLLASAAETALLSSPSRPGHLPRHVVNASIEFLAKNKRRSPSLGISSNILAQDPRALVSIPQEQDKKPKAPQISPSATNSTTKPRAATNPMPVFIELPVATFKGIPPHLFNSAFHSEYYYPPSAPTNKDSILIPPKSTKRMKKRKHTEEKFTVTKPFPVAVAVEEDTSAYIRPAAGTRTTIKLPTLATRRSTRAVVIDYSKLNDPHEELVQEKEEDLIPLYRKKQKV